jgi:hypothetical protein
MANSKRTGIYKTQARSRVTNGHGLLPDVDGRTVWVRRFRDLLALHLSDLGGEEAASHAEKAIARRAACLIVELEAFERKFAINGGGKGWELDRYQRMSNTLRRLLQATGLQRRAIDITQRELEDREAGLIA